MSKELDFWQRGWESCPRSVNDKNMFLLDIKDNGQKHVFLSALNLIITDVIDFQAFLLIIFFRSNGKSLQPIKLEENGQKNKKTPKKLIDSFPNLSALSRAAVFGVKGWLGGGRNSKGRSAC